MGSFNHLPTDIVMEILSRLPTQSALDSKLVCKEWGNLVSHRSFRQLHLNNSTDSGKLNFLVRSANRKLYCFEYNDETSTIESIRRIFTPPIMYKSNYHVIGSINGLVCLHGWHHITCICNPVTRQYVVLPNCSKDCGQFLLGFGYDSINNEYKVVRLCKLRSGFMEVGVYTIGSGKGWKNAGRFDTKFVDISAANGVFVSGVLHWRDKRQGKVLSFDLKEEKIGEHLSPPHLPQDSSYSSIGELGGFLYYAVRYFRSTGSGFDIWLLKDKDDNLHMKEQVENQPLCWRKQLSLQERKPLALTKTGRVLCFDRSSLGIYDPLASTLIELLDVSTFYQVIPHRNTLVSLNELGEEDVKILESAEIEEAATPSGLMTKLQAT